MTRIGLISDTHGLLDQRVLEHFSDVDEIWHCGDIGSTEVLELLKRHKPVRAVYGNIDSGDLRYMLREVERFRCEDIDVVLTHIGYVHGFLAPNIRTLLNREPANLFCCGHTHILKVHFDKAHNMLCLNPGAAGKYGIQTTQTLMRFCIDGKQIKDLEIIELQRL